LPISLGTSQLLLRFTSSLLYMICDLQFIGDRYIRRLQADRIYIDFSGKIKAKNIKMPSVQSI
ncbi:MULTISPECIES: hypothetical protein, partial [unclassified Microcoleus]|uniref:hypothetical protein n=1 Tax=unclassified Microcoleus TaxID=2642155 RepID=UPI0025FE9465